MQMALPAFGAISKNSSSLRSSLALCSRPDRRGNSSTSHECLTKPDFFSCNERHDQASSLPSTSPFNEGAEGLKKLLWKKMSSTELGIKKSMISKPTRSVLSELRRRGYDVYLVGGCVRDLLMKRAPKDFDIITTANLVEIKKIFSRCYIVGRRFPICHVHINDNIVEVSSFSTSERNSSNYVRFISRKPPDSDELDCVRWRNCLGRDFTINGLMFNPYTSLVYDYLGGMEDIKRAKVQTVIPARISFQEDCARILRAIRIAARLNFRFSRKTAQSIIDLATLVIKLDKGRILMEMNYMLAYGSAETSMRLLWKFGLLELLLPIQAAYFVSQGFSRRDGGTNMLLALLSNLDRLLAPDRPCHNSLWVAILAFHGALVSVPRVPLMVSTFSLAVHNGGDVEGAVNISRRIAISYNQKFSELSETYVWDDEEDCQMLLINDVYSLASSVMVALGSMIDKHFVSHIMAQYPQAPISDLVFIPFPLYLSVCQIFKCFEGRNSEKGFIPKQGSEIDYHKLAYGDLAELRHVFARVVFDTVYPLSIEEVDGTSCLSSS